jgi:hypothetical protein
MKYSDDPELKGDAQIVARGVSSVLAKEAAQVRRNEFLAATANPIDMQIMGLDGRATLLRETVKQLDVHPDDVVPPPQRLRVQQQLQQMMQMGMPQGAPALPNPGQQAAPGGQQLMDGAPVTDNFEPAGA